MFPVLYNSVQIGTVPNNYGIGVLTDSISCEVVEERNGSYELKLKYPSSGKYATQLVPRAILKVKPNYTDDPQLFRIYKVGKAIGTSFSVYARHISYDLSGFPITSGSATNVGDALSLLQAKANGFTIATDKSLNANFKVSEPSSVRSWFGGKVGSILDLYGPGEWKYDNFSATFLNARGVDRGVTIRYGKNLTKMENTDDSSNLVTGIMAFWKSADEDDPTTILSSTISTGVTLDVVAVQVLDASDVYENKPTVEQLNTYVNNYIQTHLVDSIKKNINFDFAQISRLLKDRVDLCDTIHIIYEDYNINMIAKCISTTWDVLNEKYIEIEVGEPKTNIADTIVSINKSLTDQLTENKVVSNIKKATDLITGNSGGYVVLHDSNGDGLPDELLIMNTSNIATATKVWRWNLSGLGYSKTGYAGPYGLAMTMNGAIVADYVSTGNLIFGGAGAYNTDGKLEIQDSAGNIICRFDKNGADVKGNITAYAFDANAGDGNSYEILTGDTRINMLGSLSGVVGYNSANEAMTGLAHKYTITAADNYHYTSAAFVKDPKKDSFAFMRYMHNVSPSYGTTLDLAEVGGSSNDGSTYVNNFLQTGYNNGEFLAYLYGSIYASGSTAGSYGLGVRRSGSTTTGNLSLRTGDNYCSINVGSANTSLSISNTSVDKVYLNGVSGSITCVSLTQTSSKKYKKKIKTLTDEEAKKILELRPVTYDFKDEETGKNMRGFIAEEVDEVIPELVKHTKDYPNNVLDEDGNIIEQEDQVSLDYIMMIPYLTKMMQLQQEQIDAQQKQIDELKNEINKLKGE